MNLQDLVRQLTSASPLEVTAWATIALAVVAAISIFTNIALARSASRSAAAAENATNLQASELDVIKRQLTLSENQFNAAQQAALPVGGQKSDHALQIDFCPPHNSFDTSQLSRVSGTR